MSSDPKPPLAGSSSGLSQLDSLPERQGGERPVPGSHPAAHLWLRRLAVLLFVFLCATIGVMLMILPWRPEWTDNHLLMSFPVVRAWIGSGFVRGVCTGLGVLNVWIGFW